MAEEKKKDELNYQFVSLVFSLQQAAMAQLGKIANPATGKMEKNLIQAKATIDMLEMLKEKSKGNLTDTEQKIILNTLDNLYLNYADEVEKPATLSADEAGAEGAEKLATAETAEKPAEEKPATLSADEAGAEGAKETAKPAEEKEEKEKGGEKK